MKVKRRSFADAEVDSTATVHFMRRVLPGDSLIGSALIAASLLLATTGCLPDRDASPQAFRHIHQGDDLAKVEAAIGVWPRHLFTIENADGTSVRCISYSVADNGKCPLSIDCCFQRDRLSRVELSSAKTQSYSWPDPSRITLPPFKAFEGLQNVGEPGTAPLSAPEIESLTARMDPVHEVLPHWATEIGWVMRNTIFLPMILFSTTVVHDHWDSNRISLGTTEQEVDRRIGSPLRRELDRQGIECCLYGPGNTDNMSIVPFVVYFNHGRAIAIISAWVCFGQGG